MKASIISYRNTVLVLFAAALLGWLLAGCSDDETNGPELPPAAISINRIILNPKSAGLADTLQVTAVITSATQDPGAFPTIVWTSPQGVFLDNGQLSVRWVAPGVSTLARLTVTATGEVNKVTMSADVFVGTSTTIIPQYAGEIHMWPTETDFYFLRSTLNPAAATFRGFAVYEYAGGPVNSVIDTLGVDYVFSNDLTKAARTLEGALVGADILAPVNLWVDDLATGTWTKITADESEVGSPRHHRFVYPYISQNGNLLVYEAFRPNPLQGAVDTFDVEVFNLDTYQKINATETHGGRRRNFFPTVSSDNKWLVFVSDRVRANEWELYGLRIDNDVVRTDSSQTVRLTDTGGLISGGTALTVVNPTKVWNPNPMFPVLAIIGQDGELRLVETDDAGASTINVTGVSNAVSEMKWSPDGTMLALVARTQKVEDGPFFNILYTVALDGTPLPRHEVPSSDLLSDLTWSPGQNLMVYRVTRGLSSWFELIDLEGNQGFLRPVILTPTSRMESVDDYREFMSTSSVYTSSNVIYYLLFNNATPSVNILDISGALQ